MHSFSHQSLLDEVIYQVCFVSLQFEENPSADKHIAQLGEFAVALSRGEVDAENVDDLISNLDQLGLLPWDKTQV